MGVNRLKRILFELFYDRVYKTAYYIVEDSYLAQDITQETFIKAFRHIEDCPDGSKAGAWSSTIATRTAIDHVRLQKRRNVFSADNVLIENVAFQDERVKSVEAEVETSMMVEQVLEQLRTLDPELREMIVLKHMCGLKDKEHLGCGYAKIKNICFYVVSHNRFSVSDYRVIHSPYYVTD